MVQEGPLVLHSRTGKQGHPSRMLSCSEQVNRQPSPCWMDVYSVQCGQEVLRVPWQQDV